MNKRNKRILYIVMAAIVLVIAIVPSFAANDMQLILVLSNDNTTYSTSYIFTGDITDISYYYTYEDSMLKITAFTTQLENELIYYAIVPDNVAYTITTEWGNGGDYNSTYTKSTTDYTKHVTIPSNALYIEVTVEVSTSGGNYNSGYQAGIEEVQNNPNRYNLYSSTQYNNYGDNRYNAGEQNVTNNPNNYNLYSAYQYNQYGQEQYLRGKAEATVNEGYTEQEYQAYGIANYQRGLQDGHETSKTLVGIANVGVSGVFATFTQFLNGTSIFGITLMSILISLIIIFVVFLIFKVVRG